MDPFGYEMARDAAGGAGLPNVRAYEFESEAVPDERYELSLVRRRYVRRGGVFGRGFDGGSLRRALDEIVDYRDPEPVDTPLYVVPRTVRRRKQAKPKRA